MQRKVYQRTREHLRPRQETTLAHKEHTDNSDAYIVPNTELPINANQQSPLSPKKIVNKSVPVPTVDVSVKADTVTKTAPVTNVYNPKSQTTRVGRITKVPDRYSS